MLSTISLWVIYFASYLPDYFLILVILIWKRFDFCNTNGISFWNLNDILIWAVLVVFIVVSVVATFRVGNIKMNSRIKQLPEKNVTIEILGYILPQIITLGTTVFTDWWVPINVVLFLVVGIIFVKSKAVHHSLLFVVPLNCRIYASGDGILITNYSFDEMRIAQEESMEGLQARELAKGIHYVRKDRKP